METRYWPVRRLVLLGLLLLALFSAIQLGLSVSGLLPTSAGWETAGRFFNAAWQPALDYESRVGLPANAPSYSAVVWDAFLNTVRYAVAAVSLSVVAGLGLGFLGSSVWWPQRHRWWARGCWIAARFVMTLLRSVHELIWATLFLAAVGITPLTAVLAIALPYTGTLAKIFADMSEEAPAEVKDSFRQLGAGPLQMFVCGILPRIWAELTSYALYRFECGLRSAAVLGFVGIPTLGLRIAQAFENLHYREVWTVLYLLLTVVVGFDFLSGWVRKRLVQGSQGPKDWPLRWFFVGVLAVAGWAWTSGDLWSLDQASGQWETNLARFLRELVPYPLREAGFSLSGLWQWAAALLFHPPTAAWQAVLNTLWMSIVAISLAGGLAWLLAPLAARTLMHPQPYLHRTSHPLTRFGWWLACSMVRFSFVVARAIPEYVWAFLLVGMVQDQWWTAILAIALHNMGILGRLGAEAVENADQATPVGLRALGATRGQLFFSALFPAALPRFLVYFFYRWETCLREGTVLGMLGIATLGRLIKDARVADRADEMLLFVLLGAGLVFAGDVVSALVRRYVRV